MKSFQRNFLFPAFLFLFLLIPLMVLAQTNDTGLSGSLEVNHQKYFYKDPDKAFLLAFFPGLLIHGYGHFYANDNLMGTALLTGEVLSVVSIGVGALVKSDPNSFSGGLLGNSASSTDLANNLIWGGAIAFGAFWVVDMAHAPTAAKDYNDEHDLKPITYFENGRPTLALAFRF